MVKICSSTYSQSDETKYSGHFEKYSFPLSSFQKYAIEAIVEGHHILVTAHTGSGKTLPAEFAIEYFFAQGKKVIYTSPIKALSNQKYYEFKEKFPHISFGILTGDIKSNPEADVLIMTTEILQNTLYRKKQMTNQDPGKSQTNLFTMFDMDIDAELGAVIFDEVHYINDADRGKVWEETIMMLPYQIQMIMLSATLDSPEKFALWCETKGVKNIAPDSEKKKVYLTTTYERVVPLTHYSFITTNQGAYKIIKDKDVEKQIKDIVDKPVIIQTSKGVFDDIYYHKMNKTLHLFETKHIFVKRSHVINQACKYMVENEMLPAICFILSRKQLEICAHEVTAPLLEFDSKVAYIANRECDQIIRKLPNFEEYLHLPEYISLVKLIEKGIAIHHAGMMPVLREMVELLFSKGFVKLLFATETFAVGINMPTKTVLFTDINKFDGKTSRMLHSHEFTQMAGRAGRRGIDAVGNVVHLNNLFRNVDVIEYKKMMLGNPQKMSSKFRISYNLLLNLIDIGDFKFLLFIKRSMIQEDIETELNGQYNKLKDKQDEVDLINNTIKFLRTPVNIIQRYIQCIDGKKNSINKKRKEYEKEIQQLSYDYKTIESDMAIVVRYNQKKLDLDDLKQNIDTNEQYLNSNINVVLNLLEEDGFVLKEASNDNNCVYKLTPIGLIATHIHEIHCLTFAKLIESNHFDDLDARQLICIFSCFTNVTVVDDLKTLYPKCFNQQIQDTLEKIKISYNNYQDYELLHKSFTGINYDVMHYDLIDYVYEWANCDSTGECKILVQKIEVEKGIFLGEFIKAILKINNVSSEFEKIAEQIGNISLLNKLKEIPFLTQKFVATNQSLYV